jgi:hypothetical protein
MTDADESDADESDTDESDANEFDATGETGVGDGGRDESEAAERAEGTFVVTHADEGSAVLRDVHTNRVHTLSSNPGFAAYDCVEAELAADGPMGVTWTLREERDRRRIEVSAVDAEPTRQATEIAADQSVGELTRRERAGEGELHVITVPDGETEAAVEDVTDDRESTVSQAARLGVRRVEVRSAPGVVVVRYLP